MNIFKKIKQNWDRWYYHDFDADDYEDEEYDESKLDWKEDEVRRDDSFFADADQRTVYVLEQLGQIAEADSRSAQVKAEYEAVTGLLVDMEEIENLPIEYRAEIINYAQKIVNMEKERRQLFQKTGRISDLVVSRLEALEEEVPSGIRKMKESEDYRKLVKADLKKLDAERNACRYRKKEVLTTIANARGIAMICGVAMVLCFLLLFVLQQIYEMDVRIGYMIAGTAGAITLTVLYVKYLEAVSEQKKLAKRVNKLILLHNTVKIRYINNTNLLAYLYQKYDVDSAKELEERWSIYLEEVGARQKDEKLKEDLEFQYDKLISILSRCRIKDPEIWTHQAQALLDQREMVEVRHALISRRQKLRDQMEYNEKVTKDARQRIRELEKRFPQYASEIEAISARYDTPSQE